jgi:voltage-gated potassium channel
VSARDPHEVRQRRRTTARLIAQVTAIAALLFALYFVLPLDFLADVPIGVTLTAGLVVLATVSGWEIRAVTESPLPGMRAMESLARIVPLFLILFASAYYVMALIHPGSFNTDLSRLDALYLTITVFSTVGFGDIVATSEPARALVSLQMILDLVIVGLGVRVLTRAVQISKARQQRSGTDVPS